ATSGGNLGETSMTGDSGVLLVRLRPGVVGESRRSVHIVPFSGAETDGVLVAYCGMPIVGVLAELLEDVRGMPCELCLVRAPGSRAALRPGASGSDLQRPV